MFNSNLQQILTIFILSLCVFKKRINHFPGMVNIYRKGHLAREMAKMQTVSKSEYNFYPKTWLLPGDYPFVQVLSPPPLPFTHTHKHPRLFFLFCK